MPVTKSEKIRSALRVVKQDLLDAIRLTDASCSGDRVPLNILENMYLRASALLHQLEAGDWTGRVVEKRSGQEPVVVNLDIPVVEKPEEVHWVDNIHPDPTKATT